MQDTHFAIIRVCLRYQSGLFPKKDMDIKRESRKKQAPLGLILMTKENRKKRRKQNCQIVFKTPSFSI